MALPPSMMIQKGLRWAALTAAYIAVAWLGLRFAFVHGTVSPVWPPTGLAIATLTLGGPRLWPVIAVGAFAANFLFAGNPAPVAAGIALGNTLEAVLGALALRRLGVQGEVRRVRDGVALLAVALLAPVPSATGGVLSLTLGGFSPPERYPWVWLVWWLGDFMGALIVLPLLLAWVGERSPVKYPARPLEFAGIMALAVAAISFAYLRSDALAMLDVPFLPPSAFLFLPLVWAVLRLRPRETTLVLAVASALAVAYTAARTESETIGPLLWLQMVLLSAGGGSLLLVGAIAERAQAEQALHANEVRFRTIFEQAAVGITQVARDGHFLAVNKRLCDLLGYSREELLQKTYAEITDPGFLDAEQPLLGELFAGRREAYVIEKRYRRKDGAYVWIRLTSSLPDEESSPYRISIIEDIGVRRRAEEALRDSEQRLAGLVGAAMDAIISIDAGQRIVLFNGAAEAMFGCPAAAALGTPIERFIPVRFRPQHHHHVETFLAEGTTARAMGQLQPLRGLRANGEEFPIEASISKVNVGGHWIATVIVRDITERFQAEQALRENREQLALALKAGRSGAFDWDARTDENRWSDELLALYGLKREEFGGRYEDWIASLHPEDREAGAAAVRQSLETGEFALEFRIRRRDTGEIRWMHGRGEVFFDAAGTPLRMVGINVDITERKRIEEELRKSEERYRVVAETATDAIITIDRTSTVVFANPATDRIFGYPAAELLGQPITRLMPETLRPRHLASFADYLATGRKHIPWHGVAVSGRHRDGHEIPVEISFGEFNRNGERWFTGIVRDVTDRTRLEDALRRMNEELERRVTERTAELALANEALLKSNQELRQFAFIASHDLQTPLRTITGCVQLLQRGYRGRLDDAADDLIRRVVAGTHRIQDLIRDLLAYSSIESQALPFQATDFQQVCQDVRTALAASIREAGAEVSCANLPTVMGDRSQLTQLLQNLMENGIKYHSEAPPRVEVWAEWQDEVWRFSVRDNGIGIPADQQERIFDIFARLHTPQAYPGTGIGLAICRRVVERHGGRIWVESNPGQGSVFHFTLPRTQREVPP